MYLFGFEATCAIGQTWGNPQSGFEATRAIGRTGMQGDKLQLFIILKKNCLSWWVLLQVCGGVGAAAVVACAIDDDDLVVGGNCMCPSLQLLLPIVGFEMASILLFFLLVMFSCALFSLPCCLVFCDVRSARQGSRPWL